LGCGKKIKILEEELPPCSPSTANNSSTEKVYFRNLKVRIVTTSPIVRLICRIDVGVMEYTNVENYWIPVVVQGSLVKN